MATDRITIIRGRGAGICDWFTYRRGQAEPLGAGRVEDLAEPLPDDFPSKTAGPTTIALPASQVVTRILTLPLLDAEELAGAVDLQVDKFSPFPVEQMVYSYEVLEQRDEETVVLVAISQRTSVAGWGDVLRENGMDIVRVDCSALGMWKALQRKDILDRERRQSLLVLDEDEIVLLTHDGGKLLSISGLGDPENFDDPDACADLAEEVNRILMETDADHGEGENAELILWVWPEHGDVATLRDALSTALVVSIVEDVQRYDAEDVASGILQRSLGQEQVESASINLIPEEWVRASDARVFRKKLFIIGGGLLGLWLALLAGGWAYMTWEQARLEQLRAREQEWLQPANAVRGMRQQVLMIDRYRERTHSALETLREISALQPEGIDLISLTYRSADGLEIVGEADSGSLVLQFNQNLNDSDLFADVRPGTRTRTRQGRHRFSFEVTWGEANQ